MLEITESIAIVAGADTLVDWFRHLDEHYLQWHTDHVKAEFVTGGFDEGDICDMEEYLHWRLHRLKFRLTHVECGDDGGVGFSYRMLGVKGILLGGSGSFKVQPKNGSCIFTATIRLRGGRLVAGLLRSRLQALRQHMKEEGQNLKTIMEQATDSSEAAARKYLCPGKRSLVNGWWR